MSKKKSVQIAWVTHSLVRGGSPIFLLEFIRRLDRRRFNGLLISEKDGPLREEFERLDVPVQIIPRRGVLQAGLLLDLRKVLKTSGAQVVHLNTFSSYYKYGAIAARSSGLPVIWGIREDVRARRCRKLFPWIKRLATVILPCSHEIADNLYPGGRARKVRVAHDGMPLPAPAVNAPDLRKTLGLPGDSCLIGCVAALEPRKGILELVEASGLLKKRGLDVHTVCVGEDRSSGHAYEPALRRRIEELGLKGRVHLTGGRSDVGGLYRQFNLFTLPTQWEGISRVLLEAAEAGVPIVTTKAGGNGEFVEDGKGGLLVPPGDVQALADALERMIRQPGLADQFARHSSRVLHERFDLVQHIQQVQGIYEELSGGDA